MPVLWHLTLCEFDFSDYGLLLHKGTDLDNDHALVKQSRTLQCFSDSRKEERTGTYT